jgi:hypothetical protein
MLGEIPGSPFRRQNKKSHLRGSRWLRKGGTELLGKEGGGREKRRRSKNTRPEAN